MKICIFVFLVFCWPVFIPVCQDKSLPTIPVVLNSDEALIILRDAEEQLKPEVQLILGSRSLPVSDLNKLLVQAARGASSGGLFYLSCTYKYWEVSGGIQVRILFNYCFNQNELPTRYQEMETKVNEVLSEILKPGMADWDKEKAIHDWLIYHARYDDDTIKNNAIPNDEQGPYSVIIRGLGVCDSFAKAFHFMAKRAGLEDQIVYGQSTGYRHLWNMVKLQGHYYHLDVTWDGGGTADKPCYYPYFNLDDLSMGKDHHWNLKEYPVCDSLDLNYYKIRNLFCADWVEFRNDLRKSAINKETTFIRRLEQFQADSFESDLKHAVKDTLSSVWETYHFHYTYNLFLGIVYLSLSYE